MKLCVFVLGACLTTGVPAEVSAKPAAPPPAAETLWHQAESRLDVADITGALPLFEKLFRAYPASPYAPTALANAIAVWIWLRQFDEARELTGTYEKLYGRKRRDETDLFVLQVALVFLEYGAYHHAEGLVRRRRWTSVNALIALGIEARAKLARGATRAADLVFAQLTQNPPDAAATNASRGTPVMEGLLRRALDILGQARHRRASALRRALSLRAPALSGPVKRYLDERLTPWLGKTREAMDEVQKAYGEVVSIKPSPPPRWVAAASADVAEMEFELLRSVRRATAKLPSAERRAVTAPLRRRAEAAARRCLKLAQQYRAYAPRTEACAEWLIAEYPRSFRSNEMLGVSMGHMASPVPPRPLRRKSKPRKAKKQKRPRGATSKPLDGE